MNRILNFTKRNFKEVFRDPIIYIFCIGFPLVMLILFQIINNYASDTKTFEAKSLVPGIMLFSYTFLMLTMSLLVSKDRQTSFLKRLYTSPMKSYEFIIGYALIGITIGLLQSIICEAAGFLITLITGSDYMSFERCILLILSQLPMLISLVFLGILFGSALNDKSAPGISSIFISAAGVLGGCWMPLEAMGGFETICRFLPFYPSVYIGRITTNAVDSFGNYYKFNNVAFLGLIPIAIILILSVTVSWLIFKRNTKKD